jgi:hypothetical protein
MTEKELANALLKLDATAIQGATDPKTLTWKILDADRRRVRRWVIAAIVFWIIAAVVIVGALIAMGLLFPAHAQVMKEAGIPPVVTERPPEIEKMHLILTSFIGKVSLLVAFSVLTLTLATLATVFLVLASRRATLRQMNASLMEIAEQLKRLMPS